MAFSQENDGGIGGTQNRATHNPKHISPTPQSLRASSPYTGEPLVECEHRLKPKDRANNVTAGCKHTPLRSVASLLRKHCPRPTALNEISFVGEAFRLPFCKQAARTNKMAANRINSKRGRGWRPRQPVICYILMFSQVVEGADPYRGIEKPFISSPPNGCANITREDASILRFAPWQVCFANIAPALRR